MDEPVPPAAFEMFGAETVHSKVVPATAFGFEIFTWIISCPLHLDWDASEVATVGLGFTVTVVLTGLLGHEFAVAVTV